MTNLVWSAGGYAVRFINASIDKPSPSHYIHKGKVQELADLCRLHRVRSVIMSVDLTPVQNRNLETACRVRVVDRTGLILDIFAKRARSKEGRLQVELAQTIYCCLG